MTTESKLRKRIKAALFKFPWHEFVATIDLSLHPDLENDQEVVESLTDVLQAAIPELPEDILDQADNRVDKIIHMWHAKHNGHKTSLPELIEAIQGSQRTVLEAVVSAELLKE